MKYLFLDDERNPTDVTWLHDFDPTLDWVVARTFDEACEYVVNHGIPDVISFDHDLGVGRSGKDFANWLINYDLDHGIMPDGFSFTVHSMNPIGRRNIQSLLQSYIGDKNS